jgi:fructoselysine-6-P-deglycase FrlB-like protein
VIVFVIKSRDMSAIDHEVASQPAVWREASALATNAALPPHGARLAVIGCGTSLFVAQAYAAAREAAGLGETDAFAASEMPAGRSYDEMAVVSRSGTTSEVLAVLGSTNGATTTVAITAVAGSPIALAAGRAVAMPFADEESVVQTRFATSALVLLLSHLGIDHAPAIVAAERVLGSELPVDPDRFRRFHFLGHGWTVGLASEAALKIREAAQAWSEAYPAMEYRHGPIALADPETAILAFGPLDRALESDIRRTGATLIPSDEQPLASLVLVHRIAIRLAQLHGLDPNAPRNLTRSVVL